MPERKQEFDSDLGPDHPRNRQAAEDHGLYYDTKQQVYTDFEGCIVRDRYGQPL